jgi:TonB-linked SusC/RagA family outer membrane protein
MIMHSQFRHRSIRIAIFACFALVVSAADASAQEYAAAQGDGGAPRFLFASSRGEAPLPVDAGSIPALGRRIDLDLSDATIDDALRAIASASRLELVFSAQVVPVTKRVSVKASGITVAAALTEVLFKANVDVLLSGGRIVMVRGPKPLQAGTISGRVTDSTSGEGIAGVTVSVDGTRLRATTALDGAYTLNSVTTGPQTVRARRLGYAQRSLQVIVAENATTTADLFLTRTPSELSQIVVTATGEQRRVELGHVVDRMNADSVVREAAVGNVSELLTGRFAGVMVNTQMGFSGVTAPIRIRGLNGFTGYSSDPLIMIDGARIESTPSRGNGEGYGIPSNRLADLNLEEIESIEVVKGPAASTLYGTDAANGVIIIRTKRGQLGPARWTTHAEIGRISMPASLFPTNYRGWGHDAAGATVRCPLDMQASGRCTLDSLSSFSPFRDPDTTPLGRGERSQLGMQVSGGNTGFRYFASGELETELGFIKMPAADERLIAIKRGNIRLPDEQTRPNRFAKGSARANVAMSLGRYGELSFSNSMLLGSYRAPTQNVFAGTFWGLGYKTSNNSLTGGSPNFIGESFSYRNTDDVTRYINSVSHSSQPLDWLTTRATLGMDFSRTLTNGLQRYGEGLYGESSRLQAQNAIAQYSIDVGVGATRSLSSTLESRTSIGAQYNRRSESRTWISGSSLLPGAETLGGAALRTGGEGKNDAVVVGSYIEEQLGWRDKVFATLAVRSDGSSSFGRNLRTTMYPKAGLSWLVSDGSASKIPGLTSLRLRGAYGVSGVQPPSTAAIATIGYQDAVINGVPTGGVIIGTAGNPSVRPERQREIEAGFDVTTLGDRVNAEVTYYDRRITDGLYPIRFPTSAGGNSRFVNLGSLSNRGVEALVTARLIDRPSVAFDLSLNASANRNRLTRLNPATDSLPVSASATGTTMAVGYPVYGIWQRPITGYADANRNGFLEPGEVQVASDPVYLGPANPTKQLTITPSLALWKGMFRASALLDWRGGFKRLSYGLWTRCALVMNCRESYDPTTSLAEQAKIVAYTTTGSTWGYIYDATFLRLREVSVTALAPHAIARMARAREAALTIAGRNIAFWTKYPDGDPEVNANIGANNPYTSPTSPAARYWIARVSLTY